MSPDYSFEQLSSPESPLSERQIQLLALRALGLPTYFLDGLCEGEDFNPTHFNRVLLAVKPFSVIEHVPNGQMDLFYSDDEPFAQGAVSETEPHLTLFDGLYPSDSVLNAARDLLKEWQPQDVTINVIGYFDNQAKNYYCVVADILPSEELLHARRQLSRLMHVNRFPEFHPHVSIAYLKKDPGVLNKWLEYLNQCYRGKTLEVADKEFKNAIQENN